jgi:DNA primase
MDAVEDIKARLNIEDVVSEYVPLKRAGRNYKGLSPFSSERTPSFVVSPEKGIWHDFSSNKGGNMFSFVMEMEGLDFKGALELLARKAGIDIAAYRTGSKETVSKDPLYNALDMATRFYQAQLKVSKEAIEYIAKKRKFTKETVSDFKFGYAPVNGTALHEYLRSKDIPEDIIKGAGLSVGTRGDYDMFRGRMMIPLHDQFGKTIGFTARQLLADDTGPKYINTPQTAVYDKSRHVYGLHLAKEAIRKEGFVVLVEGNLDVTASHQAGVKNVVATAGTAMTEMHLKILSKFTGDLRLCFDSDKAGVAAAERAVHLAQKLGLQLQVVELGATAKDPDELIQEDPELWNAAIRAPRYAVDWVIDRYAKILPLDTALGKRRFSDVAIAFIRPLADPVEQAHYLEVISKLTEVHVDALKEKLSRTPADFTTSTTKQRRVDEERLAKPKKGAHNIVDRVLGLGVKYPPLRASIVTEFEDYKAEFSEDAQAVLAYFAVHSEDTDAASIKDNLHAVSDYVKIITLQIEELYDKYDTGALVVELQSLMRSAKKEKIKQTQTELTSLLKDATSPKEVETLLERVKQLHMQLKSIQDETKE